MRDNGFTGVRWLVRANQVASQANDAGPSIKDDQVTAGPDLNARCVAAIAQRGRSRGRIHASDPTEPNEQTFVHDTLSSREATLEIKKAWREVQASTRYNLGVLLGRYGIYRALVLAHATVDALLGIDHV